MILNDIGRVRVVELASSVQCIQCDFNIQRSALRRLRAATRRFLYVYIQVKQSVKYKPYAYMKSTREAADARGSSFVAVNQTPFARGDHFFYELR